jgi:NADH:ubiquinone oxidoreductase subunit 5 (subunit L)/multisubunit Na+/H+ antiporter MnhA subunit
MSVCVAWGWPLHEPEKSWLGGLLHHHSQPNSREIRLAPSKEPTPVHVDFAAETKAATAGHLVVGALALGVVGIGLVFALVLYFYGVLDPADAKEQFPSVHRFLLHKWYFDETYSAVLVRPALQIAHWCKNFDTYVIDGFLHLMQKLTLLTSFWSGRFDKGIIDGLVNLFADVAYAIGTWLRTWQTGFLRTYILFMALAAMALWMIFYALAMGGPN